jgi:hypothetical protein
VELCSLRPRRHGHEGHQSSRPHRHAGVLTNESAAVTLDRSYGRAVVPLPYGVDRHLFSGGDTDGVLIGRGIVGGGVLAQVDCVGRLDVCLGSLDLSEILRQVVLEGGLSRPPCSPGHSRE